MGRNAPGERVSIDLLANGMYVLVSKGERSADRLNVIAYNAQLEVARVFYIIVLGQLWSWRIIHVHRCRGIYACVEERDIQILDWMPGSKVMTLHAQLQQVTCP